MLNALSSLGGTCHIHSVQGDHGRSRGRTDWYLVALMAPKYEYKERQIIGGVADGRSTQALRLIVVWEREVWNIVCGKKKVSKGGMSSERCKRRWALLEKIATQYKRYMGRKIIQLVVEDSKASTKISR